MTTTVTQRDNDDGQNPTTMVDNKGMTMTAAMQRDNHNDAKMTTNHLAMMT